MLALPIVLWILPADFFDDGQSVCVSRLLFDVECYACGLTRAVMHLMHLDFAEAFYYNTLVVVVMPLLILLWGIWVRQDLRTLGLFPKSSSAPAGESTA
ncbi:MAG: DUF2752 domain-containing protein [Phaeodactylibacter sp.]|uniref:DUF2752 domain-containing protein n=1 Tax=Phaeodactylibacter sp. TaxID=1940289 RepID=UPI0032EE2F18